MKKILFCLAGVILIAQISGCAALSSLIWPKRLALNNTYTHPDFDKIKLHDIAIVPFKNETLYRKDIATGITNQFIMELNNRGWYVIHTISQEDLAHPEKLNMIDAALTGSIIDYRDYEPLKLGIKLVLKDINTGETIWSAQEVFDANSKLVTESVKDYYARNVDKEHPLMGHKLYLISMPKFIEFCLNKIIDTLNVAPPVIRAGKANTGEAGGPGKAKAKQQKSGTSPLKSSSSTLKTGG